MAAPVKTATLVMMAAMAPMTAVARTAVVVAVSTVAAVGVTVSTVVAVGVAVSTVMVAGVAVVSVKAADDQ